MVMIFRIPIVSKDTFSLIETGQIGKSPCAAGRAADLRAPKFPLE